MNLHTRSKKYGKVHFCPMPVDSSPKHQSSEFCCWCYVQLENGQFLTVPPALIKRAKQHFQTLPCGVDVILGLNGYIWLTATPATAPDASSSTATPGQVKIQSAILQTSVQAQELSETKTLTVWPT